MKIYLYDNTFEGLLTSIYDAFYSKDEHPISIYSNNESNAPILGNTINIITDSIKFKKVKDAIITKIDILALKKIYFVYLSNNVNKGIIIYNYLKTAFKLGKDVHIFLNIDIVRLVDSISKNVLNESHKLKGFIRFSYINEKFLYSSIEPDNDILELISEHFKNRFPKEYFIIHDISREKALLYNTFNYEIIYMNEEIYENLKSHTDEYSELWKSYFQSINIEERKNLRLQCRMMPRRYWKHILET